MKFEIRNIFTYALLCTAFLGSAGNLYHEIPYSGAKKSEGSFICKGKINFSPSNRTDLEPEDSSAKKPVNKEARLATISSLIVPGLGQILNKKYWKVPLIYAALAGVGYFAVKNNTNYQQIHQELVFRYSHLTPPITSNPLYSNYSNDQLVTLKRSYDKYRDLGFIGIGIVYLLNVVDANVDAQLKHFDVSDNLSLYFIPQVNLLGGWGGKASGSICCFLSFKGKKKSTPKYFY